MKYLHSGCHDILNVPSDCIHTTPRKLKKLAEHMDFDTLQEYVNL